MAVTIAYELAVLLAQFLLANSYPLLPASPGCCGGEPLYGRVALLSCILLLTTLAAAAILLKVVMARYYAWTYKGVALLGWKLRALFLLGIALSAASTVLAFLTFQTGYCYRTGCVDVYSRDSVPVPAAVMVVLALAYHVAALLVAVQLP